MKVALLISGYLRSFRVNYPSLYSNVISKFSNVDIYIHITENEQKEDRYINTAEEVSYINKTLKPICLIQEPNLFNPTNSVFNSWGKFYKLNTIKKLNESKFGIYDLVIKYRPDTNISKLDLNLDNNAIHLPSKTLVDKDKLSKPNDNSLCDIFAYGNSPLMDRYFDIYNHLTYLTKERGSISETLLYHYLTEHGIPYSLENIEYNVVLSLCNVIAICGDSASGKTTLSEQLKKFFSNSFLLEGDRYHKWDRYSSNWSKITHLNPEANYLGKMSDDIFDLKIGKNVYQVDYDHKTGKFTDQQKIENPDNIIVCGLHSLHAQNHEVYNLKVFMDTDIRLRTEWKIKRDTVKRGKTEQEVINQIDSRKDDYVKYVEPQKDSSDIIVNFYPSDAGLALNLFVNQKHSVVRFLEELDGKGIKCELKFNVKYNAINFTEYQRVKVFDNPDFNSYSYYDYIILLILSLNK